MPELLNLIIILSVLNFYLKRIRKDLRLLKYLLFGMIGKRGSRILGFYKTDSSI